MFAIRKKIKRQLLLVTCIAALSLSMTLFATSVNVLDVFLVFASFSLHTLFGVLFAAAKQ